MSECLPYEGFKCLKNVYKFDVMSIREKTKLHELHNDYPIAPEKLAVSSDMLSHYCNEIADKYEIKVDDVKKLIPNLGNKTNYVVYYRNVKLYLSLGIKLTKIHGVLKFSSLTG